MNVKFSKGQIGIMETIMVLVIIVILIIGGLILYFRFFSGDIQETKEELYVQESIVLLNSINSLSEFQCSEGSIERDCIDIMKLYSAKEIISNNKGYYFDKFGYKKIYFEQIYPLVSEGECTRNNFIDDIQCSKWIVYDNLRDDKNIIISTPVSLYFQVEDYYAIGKLVIET